MKVQINVLMSLYTGFLLCPLERLEEALKYMTGEDLFTHQIPRVLREVKPVLAAKYPDLLKCSTFKEGDPIEMYLHGCSEVFDFQDLFELPVLTPDQHESIDALSELAEKIHPSKISIVKAPT